MGIFKDEFIERHGAEAYAEKLAKNAKYQADNAEVLAEKRKKKSSSQSDTVLLVSDTHIGASSVDPDFIKQLAKKYWSKNPIIFLGDGCDLGIDRGMNWDNKTGPQEQMDVFREIFQPLNVAAYCVGNHEKRIWDRVGLQPYKWIFEMDPSHLITLGGREIRFAHGKSAAENMFLEFQKLVKHLDADVLALGHSHDLARITFLHGKRLQHLVRTGSFLGSAEYAIDAGWAPKIPGWAEYDTKNNIVNLKGLTSEGEVFDL